MKNENCNEAAGRNKVPMRHATTIMREGMMGNPGLLTTMIVDDKRKLKIVEFVSISLPLVAKLFASAIKVDQSEQGSKFKVLRDGIRRRKPSREFVIYYCRILSV